MSLLRGRIRLSTVLIALVFIVTLATYLLVRPVPASIAGDNVSTPPSATSQSSPTPTPTPTRAVASPTPAPVLRHPSRAPTALPDAPISSSQSN